MLLPFLFVLDARLLACIRMASLWRNPLAKSLFSVKFYAGALCRRSSQPSWLCEASEKFCHLLHMPPKTLFRIHLQHLSMHLIDESIPMTWRSQGHSVSWAP